MLSIRTIYLNNLKFPHKCRSRSINDYEHANENNHVIFQMSNRCSFTATLFTVAHIPAEVTKPGDSG